MFGSIFLWNGYSRLSRFPYDFRTEIGKIKNTHSWKNVLHNINTQLQHQHTTLTSTHSFNINTQLRHQHTTPTSTHNFNINTQRQHQRATSTVTHNFNINTQLQQFKIHLCVKNKHRNCTVCKFQNSKFHKSRIQNFKNHDFRSHISKK